MSTPTDTNRELVTVIASMRAKAGKEDELRAALEGAIAPTKAEDGNVNYDLHQGIDDPAVFFFYENWASGDALRNHMGQPHLQELVGKAGALVEGEISITQLRRIA